MDVYYVEYQFVAGRKWLMLTSSYLLFLDLMEIIASLVVLNDNSGNFIGGWYLGMMCTIAGIRGSRMTGRNALNWLVVLSSIAWIVSIIGTAFQAAAYNFLEDLEACSSYSSGAANTCNVATN